MDDPRTILDKATDAVLDVTEAVQTTTDSIAGAIEDSRRPGGMLNQLARLTREAAATETRWMDVATAIETAEAQIGEPD